MERNKIAHIASRELESLGGIEAYLRNLYPLLIQNGFFPILYIQSSEWGLITYDDYEMVYIKAPKNKYVGKIFTGFVATLHVILLRRDVMVVHYHAMAAGLFSFLPKLFGFKVVFQGHGIEWQRAKWDGISQKIIKLLDYFVLKLNNNIVMVSSDQALHLKKWINKNSTVITPGVNIEDTLNDKEILQSFNLEKDKYILFLGRLVKEKRADLLIDAFQKLDMNVGVSLVLVGEGEDKYVEQLKSSVFSSNVLFLGSQFGNSKNVIMKHAKLFCIPSDLEGLPITLLEAMSFGKLCLASSIPANIEALANTGIFFKQGSKDDLHLKLKLILSRSPENNLSEEAKKRAIKLFSWELVAKKIIEIYRGIT